MNGERVPVLSLGGELAEVEEQLAPSFAVHRAEGPGSLEADRKSVV